MPRASLALVGVGWFLMASCSASPGGSPGEMTPETDLGVTDGTRLVARTFSFPGTPPLFAGIYDRVERTPCHFAPTADGRLRCVPDAAPALEPLDRWVDGVAMHADKGRGPIFRHDVLSADGGRFPYRWGLFDWRFSASCAPLFDDARADGTVEGSCLPSYASVTNLFFADARCSTPLASMLTGDEPVIVVDADNRLFALGGPWAGPTYGTSAAACAELASGSPSQFSVGDPLPADTLIPIRAVPRGTGRLGVRVVEGPGQELTTVRFYDSRYPGRADGEPYFDHQLGLVCRPLWTAADGVRCLPANAAFVSENDEPNYANPDCTQRVVLGPGRFAVLLRQDAAAGRQVGVELRRLGAEPTLTAYTRRSGTCTEYTRGAGYPFGDVLPLTDFAKLDARTGQEP